MDLGVAEWFIFALSVIIFIFVICTLNKIIMWIGNEERRQKVVLEAARSIYEELGINIKVVSEDNKTDSSTNQDNENPDNKNNKNDLDDNGSCRRLIQNFFSLIMSILDARETFTKVEYNKKVGIMYLVIEIFSLSIFIYSLLIPIILGVFFLTK
jgi:hypothetical protein